MTNDQVVVAAMKLLKDLLGLSNAYPEFLGIIAHIILGISSYELLDSSEYIAILYHVYLCYLMYKVYTVNKVCY